MRSHRTTFLTSSFLVLIGVLSISCKENISSKVSPEVYSLEHQGKNRLNVMVTLCPYEKNNIYEKGKTITNYEDNFINLFENWTPDNISNAGDYKLINFSFVEVISDSSVYRKNRNYFTGDRPLGSQLSGTNSSRNGNKQSLFFVYPVKRYQFLYDTTDSLYKSPEWMNREFKRKTLNVLKKDLNIDTVKILHHKFNENKIVITTEETYPFTFQSTEELSRSIEKFSIDSLSQNYIEVVFKGIKNYDHLSTLEKKKLAIEELLIDKITDQLIFTKTVDLGDVVYLIKMEYKDQYYDLYVICDGVNKQVIWDPFFKNINIQI